MQRLRSTFREHLHFIVVVTLLTLIMTFPTVVYVFKTDVFWLPTGGSNDVYIKLWDVWYGGQFLIGQADPFFTDLMFYPEGLSLASHPFFVPHIIVVNLLLKVMPAANAYCLGFLIITSSACVSAYVYVLWLFREKWIALFGAIVFGFSPHVIGHPNHPEIAFVATIPLAIYCFHRGISESRSALVIASGLFVGLTTMTSLYAYICILIMLGFMICAFTLSRWRNSNYWIRIALLILVIAVSSLWRVYPLISDSQAFSEAMGFHGEFEGKTDLISNFVNHFNPITGPIADSVFQTSVSARFSTTSYLGYVPLLLIAIGLIRKTTRRKMLPWLALCLLFLVLRLGSNLTINGVHYPDIQLPKLYLDQLLPSIFSGFHEADMFMMGVVLPLAVLTCYGIGGLREILPVSARPWFVLLLIGTVAFEYYIPVTGNLIPQEQFDYIDWLATEEISEEIGLINLPMGRRNSKRYNLYQSLSGYPHAEGAISRTPDAAFDYIRANYLLNAWHNQHPINCEIAERGSYLSGLAQLEEDGFSHIVSHRSMRGWAEISESFRYLEPAYSDNFVSIYRLSDLRNGCPEELTTRHPFTWAFADAFQQSAILEERHGTIVVFPPTPKARDHLMRYLRLFAQVDDTVVTITSDEQASIDIQSSESPDSDTYVDLGRFNAVWLLNEEQSKANMEWFLKQFKFCERFQEDELTTIDLYLRLDIPCSAMGESSSVDVQYDDGVRLHNVSYGADSDEIRFYLAWTNDTKNSYAFSLQFFDEDRQKALQYDNVIPRQLLTVHEIDSTPLLEGSYSVQLIVYDFETQISQSGMLSETAEHFERELEIARIEV